MSKAEGTEKAIRELEMAMRARVPVIGIETNEEARVLSAIQDLASKPTINMSGEVEVEQYRVFRWTHTEGIVRLGDLPTCQNCGQHKAMVPAKNEATGLNEYICPSCQVSIPAEFPNNTVEPSFAALDFSLYAMGDGSASQIEERASVLVMCDIHQFLKADDGKDEAIRTMRAIRDLASMLPPTRSAVVLLAPRLGNLGDAERQVHRINWPLPTVDELTTMVKSVGEKVAGKADVSLNGHTETLGAALAALTWEEALRVLKLAIVQEKRLDESMAPLLMQAKAEILEKASGIRLRTPRFGMADVGGLDVAKSELSRLPKLLSAAAKAANVRVPRGVLLAGPPGTGKSLLAEVIAAVANLPLLEWNLGESKSKWYGESEGQVADVLRAADAIGRAVLWIDEGEKQVGSEDSHEVTEAIMGTILKWMQDKESDVIVVMTVNHPEKLRPELLSRFDIKYFVDYPEPVACSQIVRIHTKRRGLELTDAQIASLGDLAAERVLCGREIEHLIEEALRTAFFEDSEPTAHGIASIMERAKGIALQPTRKREIEAMRDECRGQFKPASSFQKAPDHPVVHRDGLEISI